jgi:large subunit ribosomal protein L4
MAKISSYNEKGEKLTEIAVDKEWVSDFDHKLVSQYIRYINAAKRKPIANVKDRSEVSGGGAKPWRQKGTGRARVGSNRSPLWVGGGVTHGPGNERNFAVKMNNRDKSLAQKMILGRLVSENRVRAIKLAGKLEKTKDAQKLMVKLNCLGSCAVLAGSSEDKFIRSFRNISDVAVIDAGYIKYSKIFKSDNLILSTESVKKVFRPKEK